MQVVNAYLPAAPVGGADPHFANVVLLIGANGVDGSNAFFDESPVGRTLTAGGNAQIDTAQFKYGVSSALFDGAGDYISAADSPDWQLGSQFTVECFVRFNAVGSDVSLFGQWTLGGTASWYFFRTGSSLTFRFNGGSDTAGAWSASTGVWYHVAADRDATNKLRVYVDGVMLFGATRTDVFANGTGSLEIGTIAGSVFPLNGWQDEIRITKGVARYASDAGFTPPAAAFPRS